MRTDDLLPGHLVSYLAVTTTLWVSWLVVALGAGTWLPWPLVPTAGWGLALLVLARPSVSRRTGPRERR